MARKKERRSKTKLDKPRKKVQRLLKAGKLTKADIARELGVSPSTVSRWAKKLDSKPRQRLTRTERPEAAPADKQSKLETHISAVLSKRFNEITSPPPERRLDMQRWLVAALARAKQSGEPGWENLQFDINENGLPSDADLPEPAVSEPARPVAPEVATPPRAARQVPVFQPPDIEIQVTFIPQAALANGLPWRYKQPGPVPIPPDSTRFLTRETAERYRAAPLFTQGHTLFVALPDEDDRQAVQAIAHETRLHVEPVRAAAEDIDAALAQLYAYADAAPEASDLPPIDLRASAPRPDVVGLLDKATMRQWRCVPVRRVADRLVIAAVDPTNQDMQADLEQKLGAPLLYAAAGEADIDWAISQPRWKSYVRAWLGALRKLWPG